MSTPGISLYVNADWSALVPAGSPQAAFGIAPVDARRLGLLPLETGEQIAPPEIIASANLAPDPEPPAEEPEPDEDTEAKMAGRPADKAVRKPRNK